MARSRWVEWCGAVILCANPIVALTSGLSDITGINIDVHKRRFTIGPPNPAAIPRVIQNLPRDAANFFLNPAGPPLAALIRETEARASGSARPMPDDLRQILSPFFPPDILAMARWTTAAESGVNLSSMLERTNGNIAAMTANTIVIFRGPTEAQDPVLWGHELVHVSQYSNMGVEGFAAIYAGWGAQQMEGDAYAWEDHVSAELSSAPQTPPLQQPANVASVPLMGAPAPQLVPLMRESAPQWRETGQRGPGLTWEEFHQAALANIPPDYCVEFNSVDPTRLLVQNVCPIDLLVVAIHSGHHKYGCAGRGCVFPARSQHRLVAPVTQPEPVDKVDFRFITSSTALQFWLNTQHQNTRSDDEDDEDEPE